MPRLWPSGGLWRHGDFLKLWSAETISQFGSQVGQLALPLVAILVLDASAFEVAVLGTVRVPPVHHLHAARRRLGRPTSATTDPHRRRLRTGRAPDDDPDRVRRRRPHPRPALRRRLPRRRLPGLLRRRVPVVPPVARRARADHRGQLEARDQPLRRADRGAGVRRSAGPDPHRAVGGPRRRAELPRLGPLPAPHPQGRGRRRGRDGRRSQGQPVDRSEGGSPLRPRQPEPARAGGLHRDVELLLERRVLDLPRVRGPRARTVRRDDRARLLRRCRGLAPRSVHLDAHLRPVRDRADVDRDGGAASGRRSCSSPSRRPETRRFRSSSPLSSSSGSRSSSTTSCR